MKKYINYLAILALAMVACEPEFEQSVKDGDFYTAGTADFSNYVALGNSLTAGYADGALYIEGQKYSYPNIMAQQFAVVGGGEFTQPLMADNTGGMILSENASLPNRLVLAVGPDGAPGPARFAGQPTTKMSNTLTGPFNNMGVPGAKSFHLVAPGYGDPAGLATGTASPYAIHFGFASSPETTILKDAIAQKPTFFSLWIGNNDVLGFATSGGVDPSDITPVAMFKGAYTAIVNGMVATEAEGILINIPDVKDTPYFTTVPVNPVPLDAQTAALLNNQFVGYNTQLLGGLAQMGVITPEEMALRQIHFEAGETNYLTIQDQALTDLTQILQGPPFNLPAQTATLLGQLRQTKENDLVVLTASSFIGTTVNDNPLLINGVSVPLADKWVLTPEEQEMIFTATTAYNEIIKNLAETNSLAFLDANAMLNQLATEGITFDAGKMTSVFATGGAFSLDGIHLTPRGYAYVANQIIIQINTTYGSDVPTVQIGDYRTIAVSNNVE